MAEAIYRLVFFDVDSTLVSIEGIDVLSGGDPEIAALTAAAMNGEVAISEVYGLRLDRIRPSRGDVERLAETYQSSLVTGAEETVRALLDAGVDVHLVTAGLQQAVIPLAGRLGIRSGAVHSVALEFDEGGGYAGFDLRSLLTRPGGKELVIGAIRARSKGKAALIGDGMSDAEARNVVDLFIGYGGVVERQAVRAVSSVYVSDPDLRAVLPYLFTGERSVSTSS